MIDAEEKARKKVNEAWSAKELFIILSESQYRNGKSVPRAFLFSDDKMSLSFFTTYNAAVSFIGSNSRLIKDGQYLIGRIDNTDKLRDLYSILNTALYLGIAWTDIDSGTEDALGVKIAAMFEWGGKKISDLSVLMSKEEYERTNGHFCLNFNTMPLYAENFRKPLKWE